MLDFKDRGVMRRMLEPLYRRLAETERRVAELEAALRKATDATDQREGGGR